MKEDELHKGDRDSGKKEKKPGYKDSLKSMDTEETFDLMFYRPIGYQWAMLAKRFGITPNAITIASIFLGIGAGVAFYFNNLWINILGVVLLMWADSFDSADGQLARMTKQYSRIGRILDGVSGDIWFAVIYIAICMRENVTSEFFSAHHWVIWVTAVVTGLCHAIQAAMADYYRQFHLFFLKGKEGSELDTASKLWERFHQLSWRHDFWRKLTLAFYTNYTVGQEKRTPWMQRLRKVLAEKYGSEIPQSFRDAFREKSKPLMKYTNILSFNTRSFALFAAILIFRMPWLYFAFELTVLNIVLIYMMWRHEKICKNFVAQLQK
ncbi:MAG: CDP-alcohol phosphatidyltransferase family protein [Muribaculaceae bacterium]|nr:CDP-alcohol phosphatidyltransferase family protein [Muribaculaceae bacterium]